MTALKNNRKNWVVSNGDLEHLNNDITLTKEDGNGDSELLQK